MEATILFLMVAYTIAVIRNLDHNTLGNVLVNFLFEAVNETNN